MKVSQKVKDIANRIAKNAEKQKELNLKLNMNVQGGLE